MKLMDYLASLDASVEAARAEKVAVEHAGPDRLTANGASARKFAAPKAPLQTAESKRAVAYFDLDRTLIDGYSLTALALQQIANGQMSFGRFCSLGRMFLRYGMGRIDYNDMLQATVNDIAGMPEPALRELCKQTFEVRLADWLYREGDLLIQHHRDLGHDVVMVTSATRFQAEPIANILGIQHVLCTELEIINGQISGRVDACFGEGKLVAAKGYEQTTNIPLADSYFYTDSSDDLPLLEAVGYPVVVNGKSSLRKIGQARGWIELEFSETGRDHFEILAQRQAA